MVRRESEASKASLYRLNLPAGQDLRTAVQEKYFDRGFAAEDVTIDDHEAVLIYGAIHNDTPDWTKHVLSLTDFMPLVANGTSAGILIVRLDDRDRCYALSWGMGHLLFNWAVIETGFGLRFALRRADSDQISALTLHTLDTLPKTVRASVFGGAALGAFGLEEVGEVISRLVGKIPTTGLSSDRRPTGKASSEKYVTVRGTDALSIPLAKRATNLISDLRLIDHIIETEEPAPGLEHLENTHPLRSNDHRIKALNDLLSTSLKPDNPRLALCWPSEWDEEVGEPTKYAITAPGHEGNSETAELELSDILTKLDNIDERKRLQRLRAIKIQGKDASGSALTRDIAGHCWITFETDFDGQRYVFHRGRWYNVGGAYLDLLKDRINRILANRSTEQLPPWPQTRKRRKTTGATYLGPVTEATYNDHIAATQDGFYSLDRKLLHTEQHPRGFEGCDILSPNNALIHVKRLDDSVSASHLFNQAIVSAEALRRQTDALQEFRKK